MKVYDGGDKSLHSTVQGASHENQPEKAGWSESSASFMILLYLSITAFPKHKPALEEPLEGDSAIIPQFKLYNILFALFAKSWWTNWGLCLTS